MATRRHNKGIPLPKNQKLLTMLFPDEQVKIPNTEDSLQKAAHK
jgi:hypothetical protein